MINNAENLLNKIIAENFPCLGKIWTSTYSTTIKYWTNVTQRDFHHDIVVKLLKYKTEKTFKNLQKKKTPSYI
jgi:hypothetical protein